MAEAIFTGKKVKEFSLQQRFAGFGFSQTEISCLTEYLFVCNCPCYTSDGNRKQKKI
jgi:hypothetical protein